MMDPNFFIMSGWVAFLIIMGVVVAIAFGTWFDAWINTRYYSSDDDDKEAP